MTNSCNPMDSSMPGCSVIGILQGRILEWVAVTFSRRCSQPRNQTRVSCIAGTFLLTELQGKPNEFQFSSVQFSRSVVSNSLRPHESQHPGLPVHHQLPEFTQTHVHRVSDAIQPSHSLSSPSLPAPNPSQHQSLFQ